MASEALLVDLGDSNGKPKVKGRSSFYSLPKTLSEDDDPFGVFQLRKSGQEEPVSKTADTNIGLLVQIDPSSPKVSVSETAMTMTRYVVCSVSLADCLLAEVLRVWVRVSPAVDIRRLCQGLLLHVWEYVQGQHRHQHSLGRRLPTGTNLCLLLVGS